MKYLFSLRLAALSLLLWLRSQKFTVLLLGNGLQEFANETKARTLSIFMANAFAPQEGNWVQLSPFGDFGNRDAKGKSVIQRFQKEDAVSICNAFNNDADRKIKQPLGMPFYIGHPDHPRFRGQPGHTDTASKGRGKVMEVRHDPNCKSCADFANSGAPCADHGLFVQMQWNPEGQALIANESFHGHSVNWGAIPAGRENGIQIFRPVRVKSTGFTNEPQIPVTPATLANELSEEEDNQETQEIMIPNALKILAGFKADEDVTIEQITTALEGRSFANESFESLALILLANAEAAPEDHKDLVSWIHELLGTDPEKGVEPLKAALTDKVTKAGHMDKVKKTGAKLTQAYKANDEAHQALRTQLANERKERATLLVDAAVKDGKVVTADRTKRIEDLANAEDFSVAATGLANQRPVVKVAGVTVGLAGKHVVITEQSRTAEQKLQTLLTAREQQFPNEDYMTRWNAVTGSTEGEQLMAQMKPAGTKEG